MTYPSLTLAVGDSVAFPGDCDAGERADFTKWKRSTASWFPGFLGTPNAAEHRRDVPHELRFPALPAALVLRVPRQSCAAHSDDHVVLRRSQAQGSRCVASAAGAVGEDAGGRASTPCSVRRSSRRSRRRCARPRSAWGASGGPRRSSGSSRASSPRRWATPGGTTPNPTYREVCSGGTGHTEVVRVVYDPAKVSFEELLRVFWENHDPTQGMRQGNDVGTQYRSGIYVEGDEQQKIAEASRAAYQAGAHEGGPRRDHDRDRAARRVLLRRGLPSAVPGQEPGRLLRPRRHRGLLPGWPRRGRRPSKGAAGPVRPGCGPGKAAKRWKRRPKTGMTRAPRRVTFRSPVRPREHTMMRKLLRATLPLTVALSLAAGFAAAEEPKTLLGKWMKPNMGAPLAGQDFDTLAKSLTLVASKPPPGQLSQLGADGEGRRDRRGQAGHQGRQGVVQGVPRRLQEELHRRVPDPRPFP